MTPQEQRDEILRLTERYKADEARRRVPMLTAAQQLEAGNAPAFPAMPTPLTEADEPGNLEGRPSPQPPSMRGRAAELLQLTEGYRADEARRRVPIRDAAQMGAADPSMLDEFAHLREQYQPVEGGSLPRFSRAPPALAPEPPPFRSTSNMPTTVASTGGPTPVFQPWLTRMIKGGPAPMEPDLLQSQQGAQIEPGMTRRPGILPLTRDAQTGQLQFAMPRFLDATSSALPSTKGAVIAKGLGHTPMELAPGEVSFGAGAVKGTRVGPGTWYHPISENKLLRPLEEMSATRVPTADLAPRKALSPADLQGEVMMPLVGDRTAAGAKLTAVNEQPLAHAVELQGGPDYMRANDALWASQKGAANTFQNTRVNKLAEETGQRPLAVYTAMSPTGGDYAHMTADTLIGMLPSQKISQKNLAKFRSGDEGSGLPNSQVQPRQHRDAPQRAARTRERADARGVCSGDGAGPLPEGGLP